MGQPVDSRGPIDVAAKALGEEVIGEEVEECGEKGEGVEEWRKSTRDTLTTYLMGNGRERTQVQVVLAP